MKTYLPTILFEKQARLKKEKIAVISGDTRLTYQTLNARANRLARILISHKISYGSSIGISIGNTTERLISLLALLKCGYNYVPIDKNYPSERLENIINAVNIKYIIADQASYESIPQIKVPLLQISKLEFLADKLCSNDLPICLNNSSSMYIIFTSGSTGQPKAVSIALKAYMSHFYWAVKQYQFQPTDRWLHTINPCFDPSIDELMIPILTGGQIIFTNKEQFNPRFLLRTIQKYRATFIAVVPTTLSLFLKFTEFSQCTTLKTIIVGGEIFQPELGRKVKKLLPNTNIYNVYGPTEATISVSAWKLDNCNRSFLPIGLPSNNSKFYLRKERTNLINKSNILIPRPGIQGELCISGDCLATEYVHDPLGTAKKFTRNPYYDDEIFPQFKRIYLTGDICRVNKEGLFYFINRDDDQVKINGMRVELGEIESALVNLPSIFDAVTFIYQKKLIAAIISKYRTDQKQEEYLLKEILSQLRKKLPEKILPKKLFFVDEIPRKHISNKVDKEEIVKRYILKSSEKTPIIIPQEARKNTNLPNARLNPSKKTLTLWSKLTKRYRHTGPHHHLKIT